MSLNKGRSPLGTKIRRSFLIIVGTFAFFGATMLFSIYRIGQNAPRVIDDNYISIVATNGMISSWQKLQTTRSEFWSKKFEESLNLEKTSISEPGEGEVVMGVENLWQRFKKNPASLSRLDREQMTAFLNNIRGINHKAIFSSVAANNRMVKKVISFGGLLLFMLILLSLTITKIMAEKLSDPLNKLASILRQNPSIENYLTLPESSTLEVEILSEELMSVWNKLSDLKKLDVEELAKREAKLQIILNSVEDAILVLDKNQIVLHCNPGMQNILGKGAEELIGKDWRALATVLKKSDYEALSDALSTSSGNLDFRVSGKERFFEYKVKPILGTLTQNGVALLLCDVTVKKQQETLKAEFIGVLSHELKTPLQSLSMALELLHNRKQKFEEKDWLLIQTANDDTSRIRTVAQEFMHVSRNRNHSLKLKFDFVNPLQHIENWLKPFRLVAESKKVRIDLVNRLQLADKMRIDTIKFPWVLSNLLSNAVRMTPSGGVINVSILKNETHFLIKVSDEGPGIPLESQGRIFEPYFQLPHENSIVQNGFLGIGLSIAKEVVDAHEGILEYRPNTPSGAVFEVGIPICDERGQNS